MTHLCASQVIRGEVLVSLFSSKYCLMRSSTSAVTDRSVSKEGSSFQESGHVRVSGSAIVMEMG